MTTRPSSLELTLRAALVPAMRAKDTVALTALRSALAAIADAEAVDASTVERLSVTTSGHVAGAVTGIGAGEVARRQLSDDDVRRIVLDGVLTRRSDADTLQRYGAAERADTLRAEAEVLSTVLRHVPVEPSEGF